MNEHLKPVFKVILPRLEGAQIDYWVFGGVGVAACAGSFIREDNKDVDIFVRDTDFERAEAVLVDLSKLVGFKLEPGTHNEGERPKVEIKISGVERFSMIPVYEKDTVVIFKYNDGDQKYPNQILKRIERNVSDCRFFTSSDEFIKDMLIKYIKIRQCKKKNCDKIKKDAKAVLSAEEFSALFGLQNDSGN